jgi:hypothetical protein
MAEGGTRGARLRPQMMNENVKASSKDQQSGLKSKLTFSPLDPSKHLYIIFPQG